MREYIRHPSNIPIEYYLENAAAYQKEYMNNISLGGLSFKSKTYIETGSRIVIRIPLLKPDFEEEGKVIWINKNKDVYNAGIQFINPINEYRIQVIEMVCNVEFYLQEILNNTGRTLSIEEAASEWIEKHGKEFFHD